MSKMNDIKEMLCRELDEIAAKGNISLSDLDTIDKLTHSIKSISAIEQMDDKEERYRNRYSAADRRPMYSMNDYAMAWRPDGYSMGYPMPVSYAMDDYSGRYQRRDSMGRYSRDNRDDYDREDYSRHGETGSKDQMIAKMRRMLGDAPDEKTRTAILSALSAMEK